MRKLFFLVTAMLFAFTGLSAQNDCATAVPITSIPFSSGTQTTCGTGNDYIAGSYCASANYGGGEDYVYSIAINNAPVSLQLNLGGSAVYKIVSVHSACPPTAGNCIGGFTTGTGSTGTGIVHFPSNGTYFIVIDTWPAPACGEFTLDVVNAPPPPANDNCSGAIAFPTIPADGTCANVTINNNTATASGLVGCTGTADDDVWWKFTVPAGATSLAYNMRTISGNSDHILEVFSGDCGTLVSMQCLDPEAGIITGLTAGTTYYMRTYTKGANTVSEYEICLQTPLANDDCANAINLTVSPNDSCSGMVAGNTIGATASTGVPAPTCSATGVNDDVWYKFTATSTTHMVTLHYYNNATAAVQILSGSCGALVNMQCAGGAYGAANTMATGLTVGDTYYVRVYSTSATATIFTSFDICVSTPVAPTNDTCATPIALVCNQTAKGSIGLATNDTLPTSTCGSTGTTATNKGVWFTYTPTVSGNVTIDACGSDYDTYMRVYTGDCSTLTCVSNTSGVGYADAGCTGNVGNNPIVTFAATAGTTYYILLTNYSTTTVGTYNIKVTDPNCAPPCPDVTKHLTQTTSTAITDGIQCTAVGTSSVYRQFALSGSATNTVKVNKINVGLRYDGTPGVRTFTVKVHTASGPLPSGTLTEVYSETFSPSISAHTYYSAVLTTPPSIPANSSLVIEYSTDNRTWLLGMNADGETATAYVGCNGGALTAVNTIDPTWNMVLDADISGSAPDLGSITPAAVTITEGQSTTLTASAGTAYLWSTGETTQSITVSPTATTTYTCHITFAPGCTGDYSSVVTVVPPTYCDPHVYTSVEGITNVTFGTINNTSALPGTSYEDYTALAPANVERTATYPLSVQCFTGGNFMHRNFAYIDWNHDYDFLDAGEVIEIGNITNSTGVDGKTATVNVTVPSDAVLGNTRMRIHSYYTSGTGLPNPNNGCAGYLSWGSWEDYTINIGVLGTVTVTKDQVQLYPNPTRDNLNVKGIVPVHVKVFGIDGRLIPVKYEGSTIDTHKLPTGVYVIQITDKEGNTVSKRFIKE